jgi:hypothetical protein
MPEIPDMPDHVVPMDQPTSPEWAKQKLWDEIIRKLCKPCNEHGIYPVVSDHYLALAKDGKLGVGKLTVHCPNKECEYYAPDYDPNKWNDLMG